VIRSTVAHVDLDALRANFRAIARFMAAPGPGRPARRVPPGVVGVVKANAYGHGAAEVAVALEQAGATMLACADIEEAIVLRDAGVRAAILIFGALSVSDLDGLFEYGLTPTISTPSAVRAVAGANAKNPVSVVVPCHRVIAADGKLSGYGGGVPRKRWLLTHEGALLT